MYESASSQVGVSLEGIKHQEKTVMYGYPIQIACLLLTFHIKMKIQNGLVALQKPFLGNFKHAPLIAIRICTVILVTRTATE